MFEALNLKFLYRSFFDKNVYVETLVKRKGIFFLYTLLLILLISVSVFVTLSSQYYSFFYGKLIPAFEKTPELKIVNNRISYNGPETLRIPIEGESKDLMVFYSGSKKVDIKELNAYLLVLPDKIITDTATGYRTLDIKNITEERVIPAGFAAFGVKVMSVILFLIMVPVVFAIIILGRIFYILLFALSSFIVFMCKDIKIDFASCWRFGVVVITPATVIISICSLVEYISFLLSLFVSLAVSVSYFCFGCRSFLKYQENQNSDGENLENITDISYEEKNGE